MKVLIFSVAYEPFVGGAEVAVKEITNRISPQEIEFHMLTVNLDGKQKREEQIGNVHVYRIGNRFFKGRLARLFFTVLAVWKALQLQWCQNGAKGLKFDAIWAIMAGYGGFAALFHKWIKPQIPFILTLQEGDPISYIKRQVWFVYPLFVQIFRKADRIQTISNYLADFARSMGARAPIFVIPNGVDVSLFTREVSAGDLQSVAEKVGKKAGDIFLVTASRLVVKNGIADVIRALQFLPVNVKFLILGTGELESSLKSLTRKLSVADRVIFHGIVPYAEIPKYLKISDIFIRPSLSEGMGNSFIEAMAAGVPVIATPVGGIPDFLKDGETGLFCEPKNPKSIAEAVQKILTDQVSQNSALTEKLISNGRKLAAEKYDWGLVAKEIRNKVFDF